MHLTPLKCLHKLVSLSCGQSSLQSEMGEIMIVLITFKDFKTQRRLNLEDVKERDLLQSTLINMLAFKGHYEKFSCKELEISSYLEISKWS